MSRRIRQRMRGYKGDRMDTLVRSVQHIERCLEQWVQGGRQQADCRACPHFIQSAPQPILAMASPSSLPQGEWLDRQGVMDYLQISYRTYYRFKADGLLRPHRFGQRDYYFMPDLDRAYWESIRKGRV